MSRSGAAIWGPAARPSTQVLLLAGGLRETPLEVSLRVPTPLMAASSDRTILEEWRDLAQAVTTRPVGLLSCHPMFRSIPTEGVDLIADEDGFRGTAGVVRDALESTGAGAETVIVCEARRRPAMDLAQAISVHHEAGHDVTVVCSPRGLFLGVYVINSDLVRRTVPAVGYQDLKEQWISKVRSLGARTGLWRVEPARYAGPIHTREDLLRAADVVPAGVRRRIAATEPSSAAVCVSMISDGAVVDAGARLESAVILRGARVASGALVVRSVIGPGAMIESRERVVDAVVA